MPRPRYKLAFMAFVSISSITIGAGLIQSTHALAAPGDSLAAGKAVTCTSDGAPLPDSQSAALVDGDLQTAVSGGHELVCVVDLNADFYLSEITDYYGRNGVQVPQFFGEDSCSYSNNTSRAVDISDDASSWHNVLNDGSYTANPTDVIAVNAGARFIRLTVEACLSTSTATAYELRATAGQDPAITTANYSAELAADAIASAAGNDAIDLTCSYIDPDGTLEAVFSPATSASAMDLAVDDATHQLQEQGVTPAAITVSTATNSEQTLESLTEQLADDLPDLATNGVQLSSWGPDCEENLVVVHLTNTNPSDYADYLTQRYGTSLLRVDAVSASPAVVFGRANDTSPYWGGDKVYFQDPNTLQTYGACGTAFSAHNKSSTTFMLTAGHCLPPSSPSTMWMYATNYFMGPESQKYLGNKGYDVGVFKMPSWGNVYGGDSSGSIARAVEDMATSDPKGGYVCADGQRTGEICHIPITEEEHCVHFSDENLTTCHLVTAHDGSQVIAQQHDSGSPTYSVHADHGVLARGILIGGTSDGHTLYYEILRETLKKVGLSLSYSS